MTASKQDGQRGRNRGPPLAAPSAADRYNAIVSETHQAAERHATAIEKGLSKRGQLKSFVPMFAMRAAACCLRSLKCCFECRTQRVILPR